MKIKLFSRQRAACRTPTLVEVWYGRSARTQYNLDILLLIHIVFLLNDPEPTESGQMAGHTTCCREWTAERNLKAERLTHRLFWPPSNSR